MRGFGLQIQLLRILEGRAVSIGDLVATVEPEPGVVRILSPPPPLSPSVRTPNKFPSVHVEPHVHSKGIACA